MEICKTCGKPFIPKGGRCVYCGASPTVEIKTIEQKKIRLYEYSIDIVFCVDCTCSMAPILDSIKENIVRFIDVCDESHIDWRARVVLFRDSVVDEDWLDNDKPFVSKKEDLETQLDCVIAKGNIEDETDASSTLDALFYAATESEWRRIRFPGGALSTDWKEFKESGGCYGFKFIVAFTDSNIRPYNPKTLEKIEKMDGIKCIGMLRRLPNDDEFISSFYDRVLLFAPKGGNKTGLSSSLEKWDIMRGTLKEFEDPIEFYYHKELDFSPIYSVLSTIYT